MNRKNTVRVLAEDADEGKTMETIVRPLRTAQDQNRWFTLVEVGDRHRQGRTRSRASGAGGFPVTGDIKYGDRAYNRFVQDRFGLSTHTAADAYKLVFTQQAMKAPDGAGAKVRTAGPQNCQTVQDRKRREQRLQNCQSGAGPKAQAEAEVAGGAGSLGPIWQARRSPRSRCLIL